jgi:hypothetical protein
LAIKKIIIYIIYHPQTYTQNPHNIAKNESFSVLSNNILPDKKLLKTGELYIIKGQRSKNKRAIQK